MIALLGSEGSMGQRYQAILRHLNRPFFAYDKTKSSEISILECAKACDRIILATPTHTHYELLRELLPTEKPILCEKPVTKSLDEIEDLHAWCARSGFSYNMVMQYKELDITLAPERISSYDYFRHGNDGLAWDCMQIIGLARGPIELNESSPTWNCVINGRQLNIRDMDYAYIEHIKKWLDGTLNQSMDEILNIHRKVHEFQGILKYEPN